MSFLLISYVVQALLIVHCIKTGRNLILTFKDNSEFQRSQAEGLSHTRLLVSILNALGYDDTTFGNPEHAEGNVPGLVG